VAWTLEYTRTARKAVEKLDLQNRNRIHEFLIRRVAELSNPRDIGKALKGPLSAYWSYRVGDFRIICDIRDDRLVIIVVTVGNRRDVFK
jgi:mRNA interferase RelE/StbE